MDRRRVVRLGLGLIAASLGAGKPGAEELGVEAIARRAQSVNPQVLQAARAVQSARRDLAGTSTLRGARLALQGGYRPAQETSLPPGGAEAGRLTGQSSLTVPLLEQLSLGVEVAAREDGELEGGLSLSINPFAAGRPAYAAEKTFGQALARWRYLRQQVYFDAERAALDLLGGGMALELARSALRLEQRKLEVLQREAELGEDVFSETQDQLVALAEARRGLYGAESDLLASRKALRLLLDPDTPEITPAILPLEELQSMIQARESRVAQVADAPPGSESLEALQAELAALQAELAATPSWRPDLALSAGIGLPELSYSLGASVSFSPGDMKNEERRDLREAIEEKRVEARSAQFEAALQKRLAGQKTAVAADALRAALLAREQADLACRQTELLHRQGERTVLELEQAGLSLRRAEIEGFSAAAALYAAQGELLMLHPPER